MNTAVKVSLVLCACLAYAWALPADLVQPGEAESQLAHVESDVEQESLQPEETAYGGYRGGWGNNWGGYGGHGYYGGGYGYGHGGHRGSWGSHGYGHGYGRGYGWGR